MLRNNCFNHTCNHDNDIGRRKQQKLDYNYLHITYKKLQTIYLTSCKRQTKQFSTCQPRVPADTGPWKPE